MIRARRFWTLSRDIWLICWAIQGSSFSQHYQICLSALHIWDYILTIRHHYSGLYIAVGSGVHVALRDQRFLLCSLSKAIHSSPCKEEKSVGVRTDGRMDGRLMCKRASRTKQASINAQRRQVDSRERVPSASLESKQMKSSLSTRACLHPRHAHQLMFFFSVQQIRYFVQWHTVFFTSTTHTLNWNRLSLPPAGAPKSCVPEKKKKQP